MKRPTRSEFKTSKAFLAAVERFIYAQHDAHVIERYWALRLSGKGK